MQADIAQRLSGLHQTNEAFKDYQQMLDDTNDRIGGLANTVKAMSSAWIPGGGN